MLFQQLLQNLPYSPSLLSQVGFYAGRLKKEESIRKVGFGLMAIAFFMQVIAFLKPPEATIASSPSNDIVQGGIHGNPIQNALAAVGNSRSANVYAAYGLTSSVVSSCTNSSVYMGDSSLRSAGFDSFGYTSEVTKNYGGTTFYERALPDVAINPGSTAPALRCVNNRNEVIYILHDCGNPVLSSETEVPATPEPDPVVTTVGPADYYWCENGAVVGGTIFESSGAEGLLYGDASLVGDCSPNTTIYTAGYINTSCSNTTLTIKANGLQAGQFAQLYQKPTGGDWTYINTQYASPYQPAFYLYENDYSSGDQFRIYTSAGNSNVVTVDKVCGFIPPDLCKNIPNTTTVPEGKFIDGNGDCVDVPVDLCDNIPELQTTVPEGKFIDGNGDCVDVPVDLCDNIPELQTTVPEGKFIDGNGDCVDVPVDLCDNIPELQTTVPEGKFIDGNGDCVDVPVELRLKKNVKNNSGEWTDSNTSDSSNPTYLIGDEVEWQVVVENISNVDATGVTVTDNLPSSLQYISDNSSGNYSSLSGIWSIGDIDAGKSAIIIIKTKIASALPTSVQNSAVISNIDQPGDKTPNNEDPAWINAKKPEVNISLKKYVRYNGGEFADAGSYNNAQPATDSDGNIVGYYSDATALSVYTVGEEVEWQVVVKTASSNEADATNVVVEDTFDNSQMQIINSPFPVNLGSMTPGQEEIITFKTKILTAGTIMNDATVTLNETDTDNESDNSDPAYISAQDPKYEVSLDKTVETAGGVFTAANLMGDSDVPTYTVGDELEYKITVAADNDNYGDVTSLIIFDDLPTNLTYVSDSPESGSYDSTSHQWTIDELAKGESKTLTIRVKVASAGDITNTAEITNFDQIVYDVLEDNSNPANIKTVLPPPNVELNLRKQVYNPELEQWVETDTSKDADIPSFLTGDEVKWRIVVTNISSDDATGVTVEDKLPAGLQLASGSLNNDIWNIGDLNAGDNKILEFSTTITGSSDIENSATISNINESGDDPIDNSNPANIKVQEPCSLNNDIAKDDEDCKPCPVNEELWHLDDSCEAIRCEALREVSHKARNEFEVMGEAFVHNGTIESYIYEVFTVDGDESIEKTTIDSSELNNTHSLIVNEPGDYKIVLSVDSSLEDKVTSEECMLPISIARPGECIYEGHPGLTEEDPECAPCKLFPTQHPNSERCNNPTTKSKIASNITQDIEDANNTTASAGDTIKYSIKTTNLSVESPVSVDITERLNDVLEYSTLESYSDGADLDGQVLGWKDVVIPAGASVTHTIEVKVLNEIPSTAQGNTSSSSARYDLNMNNVYGNAVNIKLDPPTVAKRVESVVTQLPNTGVATTSIVAGLSIATAAYFYARSRQMRKELSMVRKLGGY